MTPGPPRGAPATVAQETARSAARRADANARRQAQLFARSADVLERSAALVDEYASLCSLLVRSDGDIHARAARTRQVARRSRARSRSLR